VTRDPGGSIHDAHPPPEPALPEKSASLLPRQTRPASHRQESQSGDRAWRSKFLEFVVEITETFTGVSWAAQIYALPSLRLGRPVCDMLQLVAVAEEDSSRNFQRQAEAYRTLCLRAFTKHSINCRGHTFNRHAFDAFRGVKLLAVISMTRLTLHLFIDNFGCYLCPRTPVCSIR